jgi:CDP-glycerol glycerophosphotransferase (TagB/SpsB family)
VEPGRIAVTGNPAFDRLAQGVEPERVERVRRSLKLEAGRPLLLVTTQNDSFAASRRQIEAVVAAAREFPALQIVVKLHPADAFAPYQRLQRELEGVDLHLTQHSDLAALLALSDLLVTRFSTTALEAMLQGKPVIVLNFSGQPDPLPYVERGAALGVRDPSALPAAIRAVLEDEPTRRRLREGMARFVRDYAYRLDGRAGERVLALMEEMMG